MMLKKKKTERDRIPFKRTVARFVTLALIISCIALCTACGQSGAGKNGGTVIEGDLQDIMAEIYAGADLDAETKEAMQRYVSDVLTADNEQSFLGTADVPYTEGIFSVPMMSSIAYQCVLLRVDPDDIETVKEQLLSNADVNKWVCVSAETVLVENVGDLVLFIMSEKETAYAVSAAFQALGK